MAKAWEKKSETLRYRTAAAKERCVQAMAMLKDELFDGFQPRLKGQNCNKSHSAQKRLVRRIVEKRMAQAIHHAMGHERSRMLTDQTSKHCCACLEAFRDYCTGKNNNNFKFIIL